MLSSADQALIGRDPRLPGLPLLLDTEALISWLRRSMNVTSAHRRYLRYKPGTSGVLAIEVDGRTVVVTVYEPDAVRPKLSKMRRRSPAGAVLAVDRISGVVLSTPAADRDLPALARLSDPGDARAMLCDVVRPRLGPVGAHLPGLTLHQVSYRPQRRWVAVAHADDDRRFVVRCYRRSAAQRSVAAALAAEPGAPRTPAVIGVDRRTGLIALEFLAGRTPGSEASPQDLAAAGAALSALNGRRRVPGPSTSDPLGVQAVREAGRSLSGLLPGLAREVDALCNQISTALTRWAEPVVHAHGDFSLDQVVIGGHGRAALIDLDRAGPGQAAGDLGCAAASAGVQALARAAVLTADLEPAVVLQQAQETVDGLLSGYAPHQPVPRQAIRAHTAAHLLRRSVEPFRLGRPLWSEQAAVLLSAAGSVVRSAVPGRRAS